MASGIAASIRLRAAGLRAVSWRAAQLRVCVGADDRSGIDSVSAHQRVALAASLTASGQGCKRM